MTERQAVSDDQEITLAHSTVVRLMDDPELSAAMDDVEQREGTAGLVRWLDEQGLTWYAGGSDPGRALREAGALDVVPVLPSSRRPEPSPEDRAAARRKAARQAERKARKRSRRR